MVSGAEDTYSSLYRHAFIGTDFVWKMKKDQRRCPEEVMFKLRYEGYVGIPPGRGRAKVLGQEETFEVLRNSEVSVAKVEREKKAEWTKKE